MKMYIVRSERERSAENDLALFEIVADFLQRLNELTRNVPYIVGMTEAERNMLNTMHSRAEQRLNELQERNNFSFFRCAECHQFRNVDKMNETEKWCFSCECCSECCSFECDNCDDCFDCCRCEAA